MSLQQEISALLAPYLVQTHHPPQFTHAELIVIALALHPNSPLTAQEIFSWICKTFPFYAALGNVAVWKYLKDDRLEGRPTTPKDNPCPEQKFSGFKTVLFAWEVPVVEAEPYRQGEDEDSNALWEGKERWRVEPGAARLYLRSRLIPPRLTGSDLAFPFLRLPPEIRNKIYTLVLGFPRSGIQIQRHDNDRSGMLYASTREFSEPFTFARWHRAKKRLHIGSLSRVLSLLLVNRQIRSETLNLFYNINTFYFTSSSHLLDILQAMPHFHRDHVKYIVLNYAPAVLEPNRMKDAFRILAAMTSLRTLRIFIDQNQWRASFWYRLRDDVSKFMEFDLAHRIPESVNVIVEGDCPPTILEQIRTTSRQERLEDGLEAGRCGRSVIPTLGELFSYSQWGILSKLSSSWKPPSEKSLQSQS